MFTWRVEFATDGGRPIYAVEGASEMDWLALPDAGVVRVVLQHGQYTHVMQGCDNYWVTDFTYGMWNDPENRDWYEGLMSMAWAWPTIDAHARIQNADPPSDALSLRGVMLSDELAHEIGLI